MKTVPKITMHEILFFVAEIRRLPAEQQKLWKQHKDDTFIRLHAKRMVLQQWLDGLSIPQS